MRSTVVVVTHNHRGHIERCLDALLPTLGRDDEVTIVDNLSLDGTPDLVASRYPSVQLIRSEANRGFGAGSNLGAQRSEAKYLVFLNPDTQPRVGWLDALLQTLGGVPSAGLATPKLLLAADPSRIDAVGHNVHLSGVATCRGWGEPADQYQDVEEVAAVSGACFAVRRDVFNELGGFDERLFLYYEDDELSLRARLKGYTCVYVPQSTVVHDHTPGVTAQKLRHLERGRWWSLLKLYRPSTLVALMPVLLLTDLLVWGMALMSGPAHVMAKFQAWSDVVTLLPQLGAVRKNIRRTRADSEVLVRHSDALVLAQLPSGWWATQTERLSSAAFSLLNPL